MNCYECTAQHQTTNAVAICSQCGAATCDTHTRAGHAATENHSPGGPSLRELPGRRLYCTTCAPDPATPTISLAGQTAAVPAR